MSARNPGDRSGQSVSWSNFGTRLKLTREALLPTAKSCMIAIDTNILIYSIDSHDRIVRTLYTEDMGVPVVIDGIALVNPFV